MNAKKFLIRLGITAAAGALATSGFASAAAADETDGWSWQRAGIASSDGADSSVTSSDPAPESETDGWSWY